MQTIGIEGAGMTGELIGRAAELTAAGELLLDPGSEPSALLIEGEPGIGKTALVEAVTLAAGDAAIPVLTSRPVEVEERLSYAGLIDLVAGLDPGRLFALPGPQQRALEIALRRREPDQAAPDPLAVSLAFLSVIRSMTAAGPLVIVVDDLQWLDPATERALGYALRRETGPMRLLFAARSETRPALFDEVGHGLHGGRVQHMTLSPLSSAALHHIFKVQLGENFPRPLLVRIEQASGGNPFFALEIARAIAAGRIEPSPGRPLAVPDDLGAIVTQRLSALDPPTQSLLLHIAAAGEIESSALEMMAERDISPSIDEAVTARVLESIDGKLRFTHPLLTSSVYVSASQPAREKVHAELAAAAEDIERKAVHLALSGAGATVAVQRDLEAAAAKAQARGAPEVAVDLLQLACDVSDAPAPSVKRALADATMRAGDAAGAGRMLTELVASMPPGPARAEVLQLSAAVAYETSGSELCVALAQQGLAEAGDDRALRVRLYWTLASVSYHDVAAAVSYADSALALLDETEDPEVDLLCTVLMTAVGMRSLAGRPLDVGLVERALALEAHCSLRTSDRPSAHYAALLKYKDDYAGARVLLDRTRKSVEEEGEEGALPYVLSHYPQLELWSGHLRAAREAALEHLALAERTGQGAQRATALFNLSLADAHLGNVEEALAEAGESLAFAEQEEDLYFIGLACWALGAAHVHGGNPEAALTPLERAAALREKIGVKDPGRWRSYPDHVEALVAAGDLQRARQQTDLLLERGLAANSISGVATGHRSRALVAAAAGELAEAKLHLKLALEAHQEWDSPFERARTLQIAGLLSRRQRAKGEAKTALEEARAVFDSLGARLWADRAQGELARLGLRPTAPLELTETERRVAELAASGLTNKEVAAALFISPKTVEANLAKVYRKLGIRSRAELGARLGAPHI